jgi:hypothetical protein
MSNHAPHPVQPAKSSRTWRIASVVGIALVLLLLTVATRFRPYSTWSTSSGRVLGTRISQAGFRNSGEARPAQIYYVGEAQIVYIAKGKELTAWLPATEKMDDRAWLAFQLSQRADDTADVRWNPSDPSHAVATLHFRTH